MLYNNKEDIIALTKNWTGERLPDGRPMVPSSVLERLRKITYEEVWELLWFNGFQYTFETGFKTARKPQPGKNLVGRAVTSVFVPSRPDVRDALLNVGFAQGYKGNFNQWVIDNLMEDDVVVVDLFDKVHQGTFVGGNLSTAISDRTKRGGLVCWGGVRDLEQIQEIDNINMYIRGADPTAMADTMMTGYNVPTRIGRAVCIPGDVVVGTMSGVIFIPPEWAERVADAAECAHIKDIFGFERLEQKVYTSAQVDGFWSDEMWEDFRAWFKTAPQAQDYQYLDWDKEIARVKKMHEEFMKRMQQRNAH